MRRNALAYIAGILASFVIVALVEALGHLVYPPPADIDRMNPQVLSEYVAGLPVGAILFVAVAWIVGAFVGSLVAGRIGSLKPVYFSSVVTGIILAGGITQIMIIAHPTWFVIVSLGGVVAGGVAATLVIPGIRE